MGHDVRDFVKIGTRFVHASNASTIIRYDPSYRYVIPHDQANQGDGYDGQFSYYIALDPAKARYYIDASAYRYERILYPMLARFVALEQPSAVPWTLLIINWLAVGVGVLALAAWLKRKERSPWFAALYGLYPGMALAIQFDVTEPLAYSLVACAIYLFDYGGRHRLLASGALFGLAALTRETTLVFAVLFGASILLRRADQDSVRPLAWRIRSAAGFGLLAFAPFAIWFAVDYSWLGTKTNFGPGPGSIITLIPFSGLFAGAFSVTHQPLELVFVGLPAILLSVVASRGVVTGPGRLERLCLLANTALMVVFASSSVWSSYTSLGRVAIAIVLSAVICIPYLPGRLSVPIRGPRAPATWAVLAACVLWLALLPATLYYGFSQRHETNQSVISA